MDRSRAQQIFARFPFLKAGADFGIQPPFPNIEGIDPEKITVNGVSAELLNARPWYKEITSERSGHAVSEHVFVLDDNDRLLARVQQSKYIKKDGSHLDECHENETVGEVVSRITNPSRILTVKCKIWMGLAMYNQMEDYEIGLYELHETPEMVEI